MGSEHSSVLDNEKGHQRILVLRRTEKRKLMNHLQKVSCNTPIQQFLSFSKGQKRKKKIRTRKAWEQFDKLGRNCDLCGEVYEEEQNKETYTLKIQLRMTLPCTRVLFMPMMFYVIVVRILNILCFVLGMGLRLGC